MNVTVVYFVLGFLGLMFVALFVWLMASPQNKRHEMNVAIERGDLKVTLREKSLGLPPLLFEPPEDEGADRRVLTSDDMQGVGIGYSLLSRLLDNRVPVKDIPRAVEILNDSGVTFSNEYIEEIRRKAVERDRMVREGKEKRERLYADASNYIESDDLEKAREESHDEAVLMVLNLVKAYQRDDLRPEFLSKVAEVFGLTLLKRVWVHGEESMSIRRFAETVALDESFMNDPYSNLTALRMQSDREISSGAYRQRLKEAGEIERERREAEARARAEAMVEAAGRDEIPPKADDHGGQDDPAVKSLQRKPEDASGEQSGDGEGSGEEEGGADGSPAGNYVDGSPDGFDSPQAEW